MKVVAVQRALARLPSFVDQALIHTGQPYDANMSAGCEPWDRTR